MAEFEFHLNGEELQFLAECHIDGKFKDIAQIGCGTDHLYTCRPCLDGLFAIVANVRAEREAESKNNPARELMNFLAIPVEESNTET